MYDQVIKDFLRRAHQDAPDLIYGVEPGQGVCHYTDLGGLHGIVTSQDLWLTDSRYCNDVEELTHGYNRVHAMIQVRLEQAPDQAGSEKSAYLKTVASLLPIPPRESVYIACFCLSDNLLSQWRGYAENGNGVAIEFDAMRFNAVTGDDSPVAGLMRFWKVVYETKAQDRIIAKALDFGAETSGTVEERAKRAADVLSFFAPTFKNSDFKEEQECRLILCVPPESSIRPSFRVARGMMVPYWSLKSLTPALARLPITRVRVGPGPNKKLNMLSIQALLESAGYDKDKLVEVSDTPFRA